MQDGIGNALPDTRVVPRKLPAWLPEQLLEAFQARLLAVACLGIAFEAKPAELFDHAALDREPGATSAQLGSLRAPCNRQPHEVREGVAGDDLLPTLGRAQIVEHQAHGVAVGSDEPHAGQQLEVPVPTGADDASERLDDLALEPAFGLRGPRRQWEEALRPASLR